MRFVSIATAVACLVHKTLAWQSSQRHRLRARSTQHFGFHRHSTEQDANETTYIRNVAEKFVKRRFASGYATLLTSVTLLVPTLLSPLPALAHTEIHRFVAQQSTKESISSSALSTSFVLTFLDDEDVEPSATQQQQLKVVLAEPKTALDEAWTLINKYYIDRTFHGQDWNAVKEKYTTAMERSNGVDETKLITEMVQSLGDKYSRLLTAEQYAAIQKYDLIGVGATLMPNADKQIMVGAPPIPGSAADQAGLQVGDVVQAVNGKATHGRTAFDIIDQIAQDDPNAATITLTIRKANDLPSQAVDYTLARQFQKIKNPVEYKISEQRSDGIKVGLVRITEFNALVKPKLEDALQALSNQGANAFVLDLRGNGGGAFQSAVEISSLFLETQQIATFVVDGTSAEIPFATVTGRLAVDPNSPVVIWMDGRTASASEVLAAALHDNCRAILAGNTSFGKGLIQAVYGLKNGDGLVLTVAKYVTPKHSEIQGVGLQPDVKGMVPGTLIPGLYSDDTSKVDFRVAGEQLKMCIRPQAVQASASTSTLTTNP